MANEIMMAGPASSAATWPVITKMPAPMIAPMPSEVRPIGPSTRRSRPSSATISACSVSSDLVANSRLKNIDPSLLLSPSPQEEDGDTSQDQDQPRPGELRFDHQQVEHHRRTQE